MGTPARRAAFDRLPVQAPVDHPGLALSRYLAEHADTQQKQDGQRPEKALLVAVSGSKTSQAYTRAFARWRDLQLQRSDAQAFLGALATPLAVGLGNESMLETGLTLHHTYGVPVIPGSALKGLCRRVARGLVVARTMSADQFAVLFGSGEESARTASHLVFWDAWYDPESVGGEPLKRDVVTVHHTGYYQTRGKTWPTDFDDPNPVGFIVVRPKARFLFTLSFTLSAPSAAWLDYTTRLLQWGLVHRGVGAKTNAGYGYFEDAWERVDGSEPAAASPEEVWSSCLLHREIVKGAVRVQVRGGPEPLVVEQSEWQPIEQALPEAQRGVLRKGKPVRAVVRIRREGQVIRLVGVEVT